LALLCVSALELARIVIVDPHCSQARYEVDRALDPVADVLGHPVNVSVFRLRSVIPWGVKLRRIGQRIDRWATAKTREWRDLEVADRLIDR